MASSIKDTSAGPRGAAAIHPRIGLLVSTGGVLLNEALKRPRFRSRIFAVLFDRRCSDIQRVWGHGVPAHLIPEKDDGELSEYLLKFGEDNCDKKLCKLAIRQLMESRRCTYSYVGGSYVTLPPEEEGS